MDNQKYQKLLQYLKNLIPQGEDYEKWAIQFREYNDHIYKGDKRVIPIYKTKWIISVRVYSPVALLNDLTMSLPNG